jgi:hypothetical protein
MSLASGFGHGNARRAKEFIPVTHFRHPKFIGGRAGVPRLYVELTISIVKLDRRIKTALDETRLLILGSQVLFDSCSKAFFRTALRDFPGARNIWSAPRWR